MKKTRLDHQQDFLLATLRPLVYLWMRIDAKRTIHLDPRLSFRRKEPFVMVANHTFLFDVVHVPLRFRNVPFIIASQTLFTKQPAKFLVSQVAHVIPKAKGKSDIATIMNIFNAVKKGYPILIFPEGDTTFYGETNYIEESTMKLIKKLKLDVVTCNVKGGYLSKPRWATGKRRNRRIELDYKLEIPKERLEELSPDEIGVIINKALYHNAYEYQREKMIPHPGKRLAEGIENVVYVCPHCESINTIVSDRNEIFCSACKKEGYIDKYGFIHGFKFDNLIDWDRYQRDFTDKLRESVITSQAEMFYLKMETGEQIPVGEVIVKYENRALHISGAHEESLPIEDITNATVTLRRDLGFAYQDRHFILKLDKYNAAFLRILQDKY